MPNIRQAHKALSQLAFMPPAVLLLVLIVACDPGMAVRQRAAVENGSNYSSVILRVKTTHQFIGDTRYAPQVTVTNSSQAVITITGVELATKQRTYAEHSFKAVLPGQSESLTVLFRLDENVTKTFPQPAELRVRYRLGDGEDIARTVIERGSFDDSR